MRLASIGRKKRIEDKIKSEFSKSPAIIAQKHLMKNLLTRKVKFAAALRV